MDLYSLFKFLQCSPFDDLRVFNTQVTENWKARSDPVCIAKLKTLVNCLSLRRPKDTIKLLPRKDETDYLDFDTLEWEDYQRARSTTLSSIGRFGSGDRDYGNGTFLNVLKWVNELRLICNHGIRPAEDSREGTQHLPGWSALEAQKRFDQLDALGLAKCSNLACCQDLSSVLSNEADAEHEEEPRICESLEIWCSLCFKEQSRKDSNTYQICNHLPRRPQKLTKIDIGSTTSHSMSLPLLSNQRDSTSKRRVPTKVKRLVQNLLETPEDIKRFAF